MKQQKTTNIDTVGNQLHPNVGGDVTGVGHIDIAFRRAVKIFRHFTTHLRRGEGVGQSVCLCHQECHGTAHCDGKYQQEGNQQCTGFSAQLLAFVRCLLCFMLTISHLSSPPLSVVMAHAKDIFHNGTIAVEPFCFFYLVGAGKRSAGSENLHTDHYQTRRR